MKNMFVNAVGISKQICKAKVNQGDIVIDATMGNGNDTAFLCELVGEEGKVYAFDIQEQAVIKTREKLKDMNIENRVELIHDGHESIDNYVKEKVKLIIYNLGYLPRGDHSITTKSETTVESIKKGLRLLEDSGLILLVIYSGHESGMKEKIALEEFSKYLDQSVYSVVNISFTNQVNNPPEIICIEKIKEKKS